MENLLPRDCLVRHDHICKFLVILLMTYQLYRWVSQTKPRIVHEWSRILAGVHTRGIDRVQSKARWWGAATTSVSVGWPTSPSLLPLIGYPRQDRLEKALAHNCTTEDLEQALAHARRIGRDESIDKILKEYDIDVIIGPAESAMPTIAAASGMETSLLSKN